VLAHLLGEATVVIDDLAAILEGARSSTQSLMTEIGRDAI
jgi:hypothetical protein